MTARAHSQNSTDRLVGERLDAALRTMPPLPLTRAGRVCLYRLAVRPEGDAGNAALGRDLLAAAKADPALAGEMLHYALGEGHPVRSLPQAAEALGPGGLWLMSVRLVLESTQADLNHPDDDQRDAMARHCLATAMAARLLAERSGLALDAEEVYLAGLLHDLGKLALAAALPKSYTRVLQAAKIGLRAISDSEAQTFGVEHTQVAHRLGQLWKLPESLSVTAWLHHQPLPALPEAVADRRLVATVGLADALARQLELGFSGSGAATGSLEQLAEPLNVTKNMLDEVRKALPEQVDAVWAGLPDGPPPPADAMVRTAMNLLESHRRLDRQDRQARQWRESFDLLKDLDDVGPDPSLGEMLLRVGAAAAAYFHLTGDAGEPVIAYALDQTDDEPAFLLAVRCDGDRADILREIPVLASADIVPADRQTADAAIGPCLANPDALSDWVDLRSYEHRPLCCSQRWAGGVLIPLTLPRRRDDENVWPVLAREFAAAIRNVLGWRRADRLNEQLAVALRRVEQASVALAEARSLAAINEMAGGAAHELNTPLAVISGRAQLMRDRATDEEQRRTWQTIADQAHRISDIITDLMNVVRPPVPSPKRLPAAAVLRQAVEAFTAEDAGLAGGVSVEFDAGTASDLWADAQQIQWVLQELLRNAAMARRGPLRIRLSAQDDPESDSVLLTVADDGPGMDERTLEQAFTPFFSSHRASRRRGMGLMRARRLIEINGGTLHVRSRLEHGTTVVLLLPAEKGPLRGRSSPGAANT